MLIKPFSTTGIGSVALLEPLEACRIIIETFDIPFWPQLPRLSFREGMISQYTEGMPFIKEDPKNCSLWLEEEGDELERFYETYTDETLIAVSAEYARGLHAFLGLIRQRNFDLLKGHVTGPLTFSLGLKDGKGRAAYFNEELREICLMLLKAKIRWQIEALKPSAKGIIMFMDEPILSALGSTSYIGVQRHEALRLLKETVECIKAAGAVSGIHCCGRAEWPLIIESGVSIISFDAYEYADTLTIYPSEIKGFMEAGGILAWGIVPTTDAIADETPESMKKRFHETLNRLSRHIPQGLLLKNIILTPSCGTGSRSIEETLKIFQLLMRLKEDVS